MSRQVQNEAHNEARGLAQSQERSLRDWLEYIAQTAIDMLDAMDAPHEDLEPDDIEPVQTVEGGWQ